MGSIYKDLNTCSVTSKRALSVVFCGALLMGATPALSDSDAMDGANRTVLAASEAVTSNKTLSVQGSVTQGAAAPSFLDDLRNTLERIAVMAGRPEVGPHTVQHTEDASSGALAAEINGLDPATMSASRLDTAAPQSLLGRIKAYKDAILAQAEAMTLLREAKGDRVELTKDYDRGRTDRIIKAIAKMRDIDPTNQTGLERLHTELAASQAADRAHEIERNGIDYDITVLEMVTRDAQDDQTDALVSASGGRTLSAQALAELHEWLDLAPPRAIDAQGLTDVSGQIPLDRNAVEG